ncbi:ATP phosphoribosyltransferase regulatory subunit [Acidocella sp.]|uniref:ATP phosphoribosyltransferase regulatory subunit n=1 Tax=Acidocella sp. TaxID=50710 RepID=UPI0026257AB6|nr:ATP phosphoribosyltransferase regulatory subunit [Acidocella sp.]
MDDTTQTSPALLPVGLRDILPPEAELEARLVTTLMDRFAAHGFERVKPPLLEFEDSLFSGSGAATLEQTFRLLDPESQRMMGLRADTTPQIARIAATRLAHAPRPLRLSYAGQCLRVMGTQLEPERQIAQAGIELIGADSAEADAEIILTGIAGLRAVGLSGLSVDLTIPTLVPQLLSALPPGPRHAAARALDRKDSAVVAELGGPIAATLLALLGATGEAARVLPALRALALPAKAGAHITRLTETIAILRALEPELALTIDPVEFRGYQYHTGISMTVFAKGAQAELGRGGRYFTADQEPATGLTIYPDTILRLAPKPALRRRLYLPHGSAPEAAEALRAQGFATINGLAPVADNAAEAKRLHCTHFFQDGTAVALT